MLISMSLITFSCLLINPDVEPPTVTIDSINTSCFSGTEPVNNISVCENVALNCIINDNSGLDMASLWINGDTSSIGIGLNDSESEYTIYWNTKNYNDGNYDIVVKAYDKNGNIGKSTELTVIVDNSTSAPGAVGIDSVELLETVFRITWNKTDITDFECDYDGDGVPDCINPGRYILEKMDNFININMYNSKIICTTENIQDTVCTDGLDTNGDGLVDDNEIIDPTIYNYYRVFVLDTLGYSTAGSRFTVHPDPHPQSIEITNSEYGNSNIVLNWGPCTDNDFERIYLYEAFNEFMEDKELVWSSTDQSITSYTVEGILDNDTRYYMIVIEDIWGQKTNGPPFEANSFVRFTKSMGGELADVGTDVVQIGEGGFFISGYTESTGNGMEDGWVILTTMDGIETGQITTGGGSHDIFTSAVIADSNNFFFAGRTESYGSGGIDGWFVKMNPNGEIVANETFGGSENDQIFKIKENGDQNELLMIGETSSIGEGQNDMWVLRANYDGGIIGSFTVGGPDRDFGRDILQTSLDEYIILGETKSYGLGNYDVWLTNVNENGDIIWDELFEGAGQDYARRILLADDGGYYILAVNGNPPGDSGPIWLIKTDVNGDVEYEKFYGKTADNNPATPEDDAADMTFTSDDKILIVGTTYINGNADILLIKCDANGNIVFEKTYGGTGDDKGKSISLVLEETVEDSSKYGYIITGETQSYGVGDKDLILIKTDSYGGTVAYGEE